MKKDKKTKKGKKSQDKLNKKILSSKILAYFSNNPSKIFNDKQVGSKLDVKDETVRNLIVNILTELRDYGAIAEVSRGKYKFISQGGYVTGKVMLTLKGSGFIIPEEEGGEDIFVNQSNLNHALNNDIVKVYLYARKRGKQPEGEVVEIIKRAKENIVGVIDISKTYAFIIAKSRQMPYDVFIPLGKLNNAQNGDKVVARITDWPAEFRNPFGEVVEVLGKPGENETEMHAILAEFDLPNKFDPSVELEAEKIPEAITEEDYKVRRDFRNIPTFTIDPADAKDFDDALSLQKLKNGNWEVGVHIADVTHYVKKETILDQEAYNRGRQQQQGQQLSTHLTEQHHLKQ